MGSNNINNNKLTTPRHVISMKLPMLRYQKSVVVVTSIRECCFIKHFITSTTYFLIIDGSLPIKSLYLAPMRHHCVTPCTVLCATNQLGR